MAAKGNDITFLDDIGSNGFEPLHLDETATALDRMALTFIDNVAANADRKDVYSSGKMIEGIEQSEVRVDGNKLAIDISAPEYISYQDEGVDGWAKSRGSRFKFKTKGVNPDGEMVKSIMDWQKREIQSNTTFKKYAVTKRENRARSLEVTKATTAAYMIKRMGIEGKRFIQDAAIETADEFGQILGDAIILDINNTLFR